jgi:hypothetical protein
MTNDEQRSETAVSTGPGTTNGPPEYPDIARPKSSPLDALFRNLKPIYFFGGIFLILVAAATGGHPANVLGGLPGGLAIAGGLCFMATAILQSRERT